jgi:hypothetical protein
MLHLLDADLLAVVAGTPAVICKLTAVSVYLAETLRGAAEENKAASVRRLTWRGKRLNVHLKINAPHTMRLVWHSFGTTKEVRLHMPTAGWSGQTMNRTTNFHLGDVDTTSFLYRRGKVKASSPSDDSAVVYLSPGSLEVRLSAEYGHRLPNGHMDLFLAFQVQEDLYVKLLSLVDVEKREEYASPALPGSE